MLVPQFTPHMLTTGLRCRSLNMKSLQAEGVKMEKISKNLRKLLGTTDMPLQSHLFWDVTRDIIYLLQDPGVTLLLNPYGPLLI